MQRRGFLKFVSALTTTAIAPAVIAEESFLPTVVEEKPLIRQTVESIVNGSLEDFTIEMWFFADQGIVQAKGKNCSTQKEVDIAPEQWHHLAVTSKSRDDLNTYVNGEKVDDFEESAARIINETLQRFEKFSSDVPAWVSKVQDIRILNTVPQKRSISMLSLSSIK